MSILRVRVNKYLQSEGGPPPTVFARITKMDERGRSVPSSLRHEPVPISTQDGHSRAISLSTGAYLVEVRMPTGELLADSVQLSEGSDAELVLMAESSPHEWLSWQHLAGNVATRSKSSAPSSRPEATIEPRPDPLKTRTRGLPGPTRSGAAGLAPPTPSRSLSPVERATELMKNIGLHASDGVVRSLESSGKVTIWAPDEPARIDPSRPIHWLGRGVNPYLEDFLRQQPWQTLAALTGSTEDILNGLNAGRTDRALPPTADDEDAAVFRIPIERTPQAGTFNVAERDYAAVERQMGVELICLPTPWVETWSGRDAVVEVGVQHPRLESEFASSVIVRDQQLAVLLGFLSSGALTAVKRLAETANIMLLDKNQNPLAAAAGGYALVGSAVDASRQEWHHWIENLMERFEHVPDGAIQYAAMRLRLRSGPQDLLEATRAFKLAYRRGLPFYGLGMRWLLDGLERVGSEDSEANDMAASVRKLASRLHPQSPFTILRLGKR